VWVNADPKTTRLFIFPPLAKEGIHQRLSMSLEIFDYVNNYKAS